jgi:hypothetical protein
MFVLRAKVVVDEVQVAQTAWASLTSAGHFSVGKTMP